METSAGLKSASPDTEPELNLLLERDFTDDWRRWRTAAVASAATHVVLLVTLLLLPSNAVSPRAEEQVHVVHVTHLFTPADLTQKAPNKGKVSKELTVESIAPRPKLQAPSPAPAVRPVPRSFEPPPAQVAQVQPKPPVVIEPPKIQAEAPEPQQVAKIAPPAAPPPPQPLPRPVEPPKLTLEDVGVPSRAPVQGRPLAGIAIPNASVQEAVRALSRGGVQQGQSVGDAGADEGGTGLGLNLPPSAGRPRSNLELKSDPMGVDFRPYLLQVLAAVRRNWFAVYPEAARLGQRGQVMLQFAIAKQGLVTKVIFSNESGAKALDQAAVAAISASNPLPPLPGEFKGDRIVLQMTFQYNMAR